MKKPILLLILSGLGMLCLQAQTIEASYENNFADNIAYIFAELDMSEVTTDLLLDRAMPFIEVDSFDGFQLLDYNKLDINRFGLLYATFYGAALDTTALLPHPSIYMDARDSLALGDDIPLAVFHLDYHKLKKNAVSLNLLIVQDSQLHDVPNRPQSPYLLDKAFGVTPLLTASDTLDLTFSLPDSLLFTNTTGIALFEVDLDDGNGYQTLAFNQSVTANYAEEGEKELLFRVTLTDSTVFVGHAVFYARGTGVNSNLQNENIDKDYSLSPDTTIAIDPTSDHAAGEIQIGFACTDLGLRKPLLYIQGYFPQIGNDPPQDYKYLTEEERFGQRFSSESDDLILDVLELEGYDIIYLQLSYPGDFADRNAEIVKKAILKLNDMKRENGSEEPLIVIGASMGGLLGKYALLEMEQDGEDHEVKTLITLDSPFRGAYLPVGAQFMLLHLLNTEVSFLAGIYNYLPITFSTFVPEIGQAQAATTGGFVQEALIYNIFEVPSPSGHLPNHLTGVEMTNPVHTAFYTNLEAMGELQNCDFVALSNGSSTGEGQGFNPTDKLVEISGGGSDLLQEIDGIGGPFADVLSVIAFLNYASLVRFDLNIHALPDNPSSYTKVYKGNTLVWILGGLLTASATSFEGKVKETVPYDSAPGGYLPIAVDSLPGFINVIHENICFVPTVSALDITSPENEDLYQDLSNVAGVTSSGLSLTDRYDASTDNLIAGDYNQSHASLNSTNIPFLMAELASEDELSDLPVNANGELVLGDRTYNYGDADGHFDPTNPTIRHTPNRLKDSLWVENTGKLWVNRNDKISFTDGSNNPANSTDSHFDLFIQGQSGCDLTNAELHIENGGEMRIGEYDHDNTADVYVMEGTKVFVRSAGHLTLEKSSGFIVENGGEVILSSGGFYQSFGTGQTYVRDGGVFRVEDGGILKLFGSSELLIEPGGQLILEDGAIIQTNDPYNVDGEANIHIQGELVINGTFDFSGNGFFQFDIDNILTLNNGAEFQLEGMGKNVRFIRLNEFAKLEIGSHTIRLNDGKVTFEPGGGIILGEDATANFTEVRFDQVTEQRSSDAIEAYDSPGSIFVTDCTFNDLRSGIIAYSIKGESPISTVFSIYLRIIGSEFLGCEYGVEVYDTPSVDLTTTNFFADPSLSFYGLFLNAVETAYVKGCHFSGYGNDQMGAIHLLNVPDYNMIGGTVSSSSTGILATGQSNIDMTSGATVDSNAIGIQMEGGVSYGVLTMDCSRILDNSIGVQGTDVALNIDASGAVKTNHYRTSAGSPLFQICYDEIAADVGSTIDAKNNFWEGDINYLIYNPNEPGYVSCSHYYGNVDLDTIPAALAPTCTDPNGPGGPSGPELPDQNFTGDDPNCLTTDSDVLYDVYWDAYEEYLLETNNQPDNRQVSDSLYYQVAAIPDSVKSTYPLKCRQLIHVARSRVSTPNGLNLIGGNEPGQAGQHNWLPSNAEYKFPTLKIRPSPAKEAFLVDLEQGNYILRIYDAYGKMVHSNTILGASWVHPNGWGQGLYFIDIINIQTHERLSGKVSIL